MRIFWSGVLFAGLMLFSIWQLTAIVWVDGRNPSEVIIASDNADQSVGAGNSGDFTESPVNWQDKTEIARGPAWQGPWQMNDSEFLFVDDPAVAIDEAGSVATVWVDQSKQDLFFQIRDSIGREQLDEPVNVSSSPDIFSWLPRVVISPHNSNRIYILWQEIIFSGGSHGGDILFARSTDGGHTFSDPLNLSQTRAGAGKGRLTSRRWDNGSLDIALDHEGTIFAVWTEYEGALRLSRSDDHGGTFSDPTTITGESDEAPARGPALAIGPENEIYIAWTIGENRSGDIHFTTSTDGGKSFDTPRAIFETDGHSDAPRIAADSRGNLHMVHAESPDGMLQRYHIYYSRRDRNSNGYGEGDHPVFSDPVRISEPHLGGRFESAGYPEIALTRDNRIYVIWELFPDHQYRPQGLAYAVSVANTARFSSPSQIPGTGDPDDGFNGSRQGLLMNKLGVNSTGNIAVVNSTFLEGESSRIHLLQGYSGSAN